MMKTASALTLLAASAAALIGVAAAFVRPAYPRQQTPEAATRQVAVADSSLSFLAPENVPAQARTATFIDLGLDNPLVEEDTAIHPARKCAVCIG